MGLGGRLWYSQKARHDGHNMSIENETLSLSTYKPIAMQILFGGPSPNLGEEVELGGRMWYHMKGNNNGNNLSFETDTLSRFV